MLSHAFVHSLVGEAVGLLVAAAEGVADFETGNIARELAGFFKERAEDGAVAYLNAARGREPLNVAPALRLPLGVGSMHSLEDDR